MDHVRSSRLNALSTIENRHPELSALVAVARKEGGCTKRFLRSYFSSKAKRRLKSLVLNAVLFEQLTLKTVPDEPITISQHRDMTRYLLLHPEGMFAAKDQMSRYDIPHSFTRRLGLARLDLQEFLRFFAVIPALSGTGCTGTVLPTLGEVAMHVAPHITPLIALHRFGDEDYRRLRRSHGTSYNFTRFFESGCDLLDLRNLLFYAVRLLRDDREHGYVQNKIPLPLSHRFGIQNHSIPALLLALDVISLSARGVLVPPARNGEDKVFLFLR